MLCSLLPLLRLCVVYDGLQRKMNINSHNEWKYRDTCFFFCPHQYFVSRYLRQQNSAYKCTVSIQPKPIPSTDIKSHLMFFMPYSSFRYAISGAQIHLGFCASRWQMHPCVKALKYPMPPQRGYELSFAIIYIHSKQQRRSKVCPHPANAM